MRNHNGRIAAVQPSAMAGCHKSPCILYIQYTNPAGYPPLIHSSEMLAEREWRVLFLAIAMKDTDHLELSPHPHIRICQLPPCDPGWRQKLHYLRFCLY